MIKYSRKELADDIRRFGIRKGDVVLVRAALSKVNGEEKSTFLESLLDVVGPEGTIVGLSFTKSFLFPFIKKENLFSLGTKTTAGGFSQSMLSHPDSFRSTHPINSFVAIGKNANNITKDHTPIDLSYTPMRKIVELRGKMLVAGCVESSPGFTTVHLAQQDLGLTRKSLQRRLVGVWYNVDGELAKFLRKDFGGCSAGFYKFYSHYVMKEKLSCGMIGDAYSILIDAADAYEIEREILQNNPRFALCDNPSCIVCRATWLFNKAEMIKFLAWFPIRFLCRFWQR